MDNCGSKCKMLVGVSKENPGKPYHHCVFSVVSIADTSPGMAVYCRWHIEQHGNLHSPWDIHGCYTSCTPCPLLHMLSLHTGACTHTILQS